MNEALELMAGHEKEWERTMFLYRGAMKKVLTKIEILEEEFEKLHHYDPIEHVSSRIKSPESIYRKLLRNGHQPTLEHMERYLNDVAGIRIVCSFTTDIYKLADMLMFEDDIRTIIIKDYIASPKANGYKSYHMIVSTPVHLSTGPVETKVEIQIRTIAMDFWAALEHKIFYKFEGNAPKEIVDELGHCAAIINDLDERMRVLNEKVSKLQIEDAKEEEKWEQ